MAAFLKFVVHDTVNNTLETTWQDMQLDGSGNVIGYVNTKCTNYSAAQKSQFLADLGTAGQKYVTMAGW